MIDLFNTFDHATKYLPRAPHTFFAELGSMKSSRAIPNVIPVCNISSEARLRCDQTLIVHKEKLEINTILEKDLYIDIIFGILIFINHCVGIIIALLSLQLPHGGQ